MATTTSNLGLTLPAVSDAADIGVLNTNFQKLDEKCSPALFAPSGYGLGESIKTLTTKAQLDAVKGNGFYLYSGELLFDHVGVNNSNMSQGAVQSVKTNNRQYQYFYCNYPSAGSVISRYTQVNGTTWEPWEWVNPPMSLGVEYRTTERWQGKPVYAKLVDCGYLPNKTMKQVSIAADATVAVELKGYAVNDGYEISLPYLANVSIGCVNNNIVITTTDDYSAYAARICAKYIKD